MVWKLGRVVVGWGGGDELGLWGLNWVWRGGKQVEANANR